MTDLDINSFEGIWASTWGTWDGTSTTESVITLKVDDRDGTKVVEGYYDIPGRADGQLEDTTYQLTNSDPGEGYPSTWGTWSEGDNSGEFWFILLDARTIFGAWIGATSNPNPWYATKTST